jgi:hypothetical protein
MKLVAAMLRVLRSVSWMAEHGVYEREDGHAWTVGATTPRGQLLPPGMIWVDAGEIGVESPGYVQKVEPCAAIQPGPGRVVLATVRHPSSEIYALKLRSGLQSPLYSQGHGDNVSHTSVRDNPNDQIDVEVSPHYGNNGRVDRITYNTYQNRQLVDSTNFGN